MNIFYPHFLSLKEADPGITPVIIDFYATWCGSQTGADNNSAQSETIIRQYGCSQETIVGSDDGHHHIANQEIGLCDCHLVFFGWLRLDEVKHGWRATHLNYSQNILQR